MEKLRKAEGFVYSGSPNTCVAFSPAALKAKEGAFCVLEEGYGSGIHWGHHLPTRTGKDREGICGRELVIGVWGQEGICSAWSNSPKVPWRRSPVIRSSEMGQRETISLPLMLPLNEEVVELVGHHKLFQGLYHLTVTILRAASPQLQLCSSGGNWQSCVLPGQGLRPCKTSDKTPSSYQVADLGLHMWSEVGHSENTLELWCLQASFITRWCLRDLKP